MNIKKTVVMHPFLFALYPVLFLYTHNVDKVSLSVTVMPSIVVLSFTLILLFFLKQILNNFHKAGIIVSAALVWFFSYGQIYNIIAGFEIAGFNIGRERYLTPIYPVLFLAFLFIYNLVIRKKTFNIHKITTYLNVVGTFLILFSIINIGTYKIKRNSAWEPVIQTEKRVNNPKHEESESLRDIYYIVLDSYTGARALKKYFNFDNSKFINSLTDKGFYVASKSRSNYSTTTLSISSTLNMQYHINDKVRFKSGDETMEYQMVKNNKVLHFLKSKGYHFVNLSHWNILDDEDEYGYNYKSYFDDFNIQLLRMSVLRQIVVVPYIDISEKRKKVYYKFKQLEKIPNIKETTFAYVHIMSPHAPYAFKRNGNPVGNSLFRQVGYVWAEKERYLDEMIFINKQVEVVVDKILSKSNISPIIIIQGDHGAIPMQNFGDEENRQIRMSILNAYYLPDNNSSLLYESISPVNSFRLIFDFYFGMNYGLLEDKSYYVHGTGFQKLTLVPDNI